MRYLLAILLALACGTASAAEPLRYRGEETLYRDTVWEGEVLVDGILTVAPGAALEIRPGTVVRFTRLDSNGDGIGEHELFIQGILRALGTAERPIRFTSAEETPAAGDWGAVNMMASQEENRLEHCEIEYAYRGFHAHFAAARLSDSTFRRNVRGLQFQESTVEIDRCRVVDNRNGIQFRDSTVRIAGSEIARNYWGLRCVYSQVALETCRIAGNLVNGANLRDSEVAATGNRITGNRRGLYLQRGRAEVEGNLLCDNSEYGILLEQNSGMVIGNRISGNGRAGVRVVDADLDVAGNDLAGNGEYDLVNDGAAPFVARDNWWGTADPTAIGRRIRDRADRPTVGEVDAASPLAVQPTISDDGLSR